MQSGRITRATAPSSTQKGAAEHAEAYTATILGPDGTVYAIDDATLFAVGK